MAYHSSTYQRVLPTSKYLYILLLYLSQSKIFMFLASTVWECGKDKKNPEELITSLNEQLGDFGFPQEFIFDVWGIVLDARASKTS